MSDKDKKIDLPKGWKQSVDPKTRKAYYFNKSTGDRTWIKPPSSLNLISGWKILYDKDNKRWYYRNETLDLTQQNAPPVEHVASKDSTKNIPEAQSNIPIIPTIIKNNPPPIPKINSKQQQQIYHHSPKDDELDISIISLPSIPSSISDEKFKLQQIEQESSIRRGSEIQTNIIASTNVPKSPSPTPKVKPKLPQPIQHHSPKDDEQDVEIISFPSIPSSISDKEFQQSQNKQENPIRRISETQSNKQESPVRRFSETQSNIPVAPPIPKKLPPIPKYKPKPQQPKQPLQQPYQPLQHHSPKDDEHEIVIKTFPSGLKKEIQQFNKPSFAEQYFRKNMKGIFKRVQIPPEEMMQMQTHSLKTPILISVGKDKEKIALDNFDNIRTYQGLKQNYRFKSKSESDKKNYELMATVAQSIVNLGCQNESLCNEIICQLIKQTTVGPQAVKELQPAVLSDAIRKGWQLIMLCLERFAPLRNCESILLDHIDKAMDMNIGDFSTEKDEQSLKEEISMYATLSLNKLLSLVKFGGILKIDQKKITDIQMVTKARKVFDCLLQDIMVHQSHLLTPEKDFIVPTVMLFLIIKIIQNNGLKTEGIFRKSGVTIDDTEEAIALLNMGDYNNQYFKDQKNPHAYAVLLKNWIRRLEECIIPYALYDDALKTVQPNSDEDNVVHMTPYQFVTSKLPMANLLTLKVLSRFLKKVYADENVKYNKMDLHNVALIFTPTLIKSKSINPHVFAKNIQIEVQFINIVINEIGNLPHDADVDKIVQAEKWINDNYCKKS
ncbi:MAG: putative rho gtpase activation protein [Streblomastix strix]|uniref:Putative rho gtpase activation protein n=1 Tax=Streblomastix strix TaxID=222440 RepID=A0A5J4VUA6_9EUKA|nr:MAG: putative rho gtpase activation protein [Streblomastix strix]